MGTSQPHSEGLNNEGSLFNGVALVSPLRAISHMEEKEKFAGEVAGVPTSVEESNDSVQQQIEVLKNRVCPDLAEKGNAIKTNDSTIQSVTSHPSINDFPDEIIIKILSYMSFGELLDVVQKVSPRWKNLSQDAELWQDKIYVVSWCNTNSNNRRVDKTDDEAVYTLCNAPQLRTVLMQRGVKSYVFRALYSNCRNITSLQIGATQKLSYSVLKNIVEKCSKLQTLKISNYLLTCPKHVEAVSQLQHLRVLSLEEFCTSDARINLRPLADGCPQLAELDLGHIYYDMEDLRYFFTAKKHKLKYLGIRWTMESRRCVVPLLPICAESLERLELYQYDVILDEAREAFVALGQLTNLRELTSMNLTAPLTGIVPLAFNKGGLSNLRLLKLWDAVGVEDEAVIAISRNCPNLRELGLRNAQRVTDAGFAQIHRLKHLQMLDVSMCHGVGSGLMPHIAKLPSLQALFMEDMEFSKMLPGLISILDITTLRCLSLNSSNISAVPFERFPSRLVLLRELNVENCEGNRRAIEELQEQMPQLQIFGSGGYEAAPSVYSESDLSDDESVYENHHGHVAGAGGHAAADDNSESYCESEASSDSEDFDLIGLFPEQEKLDVGNW